MLTVLEQCLIRDYYAARETFVESARRRPDDTPESWEDRIADALVAFREAESALVDDIVKNGDIDFPQRRYTVGHIPGLGLRLRVIRFYAPIPLREDSRAA